MGKRLFDIVGSAICLASLAIPFTIVAVAIKLSSPGPVFFRQQRVGRGGRLFWLYKFRTMYVDARGPTITVEGDPRITRIGHALRRYKIDELPQLWNILCGEMSIVGPRPEVERLVRHYSPEQRRILQQTPGLASLSQLVYPYEADLLRGHPDPEEVYIRLLMPRKIAADLHYEGIRTFWSDMRLLGEIALLSLMGKSYRADHTFHV